jgi:glycosyltransferase involved in cell wall biosynthesis
VPTGGGDYFAPVRCALDATPLLGQRTGVAAFVSGVLTELAGRPDIDVAAYALSWRGRSLLREVLPPGVDSGWSVPAAPLLRLWRRSDAVTAERILDLDEDPEVVHGTNFVVPPTRAAARVVTVHDLTCVNYPSMCTPVSRRYPALIQRAVSGGAWVHTPSEFVAGEVRSTFDVDHGRVRAVLHGVAPLLSGGAGSSGGSRIPGCERYVLSLGTLEPRKDLGLLVRAFDKIAGDHPDLGLVLAGATGWGTAELDRIVGAARFGARIFRPGYVSDSERGSLLAGATVFAFPSMYEGFGLPALEAMSAGVPVVATRAGALPEVCGSYATLVPVGDVDAFAVALAGALGRDGSPGREWAAQFTWDRCVSGLLALYEDARG